MKIKVEKGIKIPGSERSRPKVSFRKLVEEALSQCAVGDSFLVWNSSHRTEACKTAKELNLDIVTRKVRGGFRVWRVK